MSSILLMRTPWPRLRPTTNVRRCDSMFRTMAKPRFSRSDAPWIEETAWIYMEQGLFKKFPNDAKLVDRVVKAFEARYGRPPKWNTPHENERLLALDTDRASTLPLLDLDRQPPLKGLYATAAGEWAR